MRIPPLEVINKISNMQLMRPRRFAAKFLRIASADQISPPDNKGLEDGKVVHHAICQEACGEEDMGHCHIDGITYYALFHCDADTQSPAEQSEERRGDF